MGVVQRRPEGFAVSARDAIPLIKASIGRKPRFGAPEMPLTQIPVAYPCAERSCDSVTSQSVSPSGTPPLGTLGEAIFHDQEFKDQDVDVEVGVYIKQSVSVSEPLFVRELPGATAASIIHHGAF